MTRILRLFAAAAAAAPGVAAANVGIGILSPSALLAIPALIPAIVVEAVVLGRMLGVGFGRALRISFLANLTSTVLGGVFAVAFDVFLMRGGPEPGRGLFLISLVPMLFVSWGIEALVVRPMAPGDQKPRVARATFFANLLTYALMAVGVWFLIAPAGERVERWRIVQGLSAMQAAKTGIDENFNSLGAFPEPRALATPTGNLRSLHLEQGGRLVGVFSFPASPDADGKRLVLEPRVEGKKIAEWVCYTPDMPLKYLPAHCRQRSPGK